MINWVARLQLAVFLAVLGSCSVKEKKEFREEKFDESRLHKIKLASDLDEPMEIAVTGDGRVIIVERKGAVKLFDPGDRNVKTIATIPVYSGQEDGLLGIALDPGFETSSHIFLYYSPEGKNPVQRISRFSLAGDSLDIGSEKVLLEIPTQREECCHSAGSLAFGPGGNLFAAVGDNTNPHNPGYYNSIDERKGRAYWDAQRTAANTDDFRGKILRIHPEPDGTYTIPEGNLFKPGTPNTKPEIYVMGCRNPYRISVDPKLGWLTWGDVGQNTIDDPARGPISYDEWNLALRPGFFGWPYFAGPNSPYADFDYETNRIGPFFDPQKPVNNSVNNTGLQILPPAEGALIYYSYDSSTLFPHLGTGGKSPIGGPVFRTENFTGRISDTTKHMHAYFDNKLFIAEWMRDWINVVSLTPDGKVDTIEPFMNNTRFNHPIELEFGPDGVLYVLEYGTNWFSKNDDASLYRIEYVRNGPIPVNEYLKADTAKGVNAGPDFPLIQNSDCNACHAIEAKSIGPSYMAIAERYASHDTTVNRLAAKIISGGSGVWGEYSMSAHPQLPKEDAVKMVEFILSMKADNNNLYEKRSK